MNDNTNTIILGRAQNLTQLNDCGCCEGISVQTPVEIFNRPGLAAILYRTGTHARFKQTMLARLSSSAYPALRSLTTREDNDPAIAWLDCWAVIADILTFYQERIANESYLRTATERRSILELARLIGYALKPGVAADTYLAFTIEDSAGAAPQTQIAAGIQVQSVPGPGEQAQIFETVENTEAHAEWSAIQPLMWQPQHVSRDMKFVVFAGMATKLKIGDQLMLMAAGQFPRHLLGVSKITVDNTTQTTRVDFTIANNPPKPRDFLTPKTSGSGKMSDYPNPVPLTVQVVKKITQKKWDAQKLINLAAIQGWSLESLASGIREAIGQPSQPPGTGVYVFRVHAPVFGYNFPKQITSFSTSPPSYREWPIQESKHVIFLDSAYDGILPNSYIAVQSSPLGANQFFQTHGAKTCVRAAYGQTAKSTQIDLDHNASWWPLSLPRNFGTFRHVTVFAQSESLELANLPILTDVAGDTITLDGPYLGLKVGQKVVLSGQRSDLPGVTASELLTIKESTLEGGYTVLVFEQALANRYVRGSVTINANVAAATHGQTVQEILGSGDASQPYQTFMLQQSPLTYVHDTSPAGAASTLQLRVNDLLWHEETTLFGCGPKDRVFVTFRSDDGKTTVEFGDGNTGARVPTGAENIQATYRKGIGLAGLVKAGRITQLLSRPLGFKAVTNPLDTTDALDPQTLDSARSNAPLTVLTLDRVVSLLDYENFARSHGAIVKALATWTWIGLSRTVLLTVAGAEGAPVSDDAITDLITSLHDSGDPFATVRVQKYSPVAFKISGSVYVQPDFDPVKVLSAVQATLLQNFSFDARDLAQPVARSEVISVVQCVPGVLATNLVAFYRADQNQTLESRLLASQPFIDQQGNLHPAELLTIDPQSLAKVQAAT
jgi:hypothetical protein